MKVYYINAKANNNVEKIAQTKENPLQGRYFFQTSENNDNSSRIVYNNYTVNIYGNRIECVV
jgi:hypothetical protein